MTICGGGAVAVQRFCYHVVWYSSSIVFLLGSFDVHW
jgi:hypothetical protein